jgi:hypothetical protein
MAAGRISDAKAQLTMGGFSDDLICELADPPLLRYFSVTGI